MIHMAFKRLSNHVSPYTHDVVTTLVDAPDGNLSRKMNAKESFLIAKQILADLPIVPTGERIYELTQQIQMGLLDEVCPFDQVREHWKECVDCVERYLRNINVLGF